MKTLNWLFTLTSINVLLVTIERFSPTTKILLQPYNFLRLHEILQMTTLILFTVVLPVFILKVVTNNFAALKMKHGLLLLLLFISGIYFYSTGNGLHEVSSFNFNNFCDTRHITDDVCGSFFFNDFYTGNIFYFIGAVLMVIPLLLFEKQNPINTFDKKNMIILVINALVYSLAIFAYAAFDRVLVGFVYAVAVTVVTIPLFWSIRKNYKRYPFITDTTITYVVGLLLSIYPRFLIK